MWAVEDLFPAMRWVVGIFFGVAAVIALLNVIGIASRLDLGRDAFTCVFLFRSFTRKWKDCSTFDPVRVGGTNFVGFSSAERLQQIGCPSLIIHAGKDVVTAPRTTLPIERGIPGATGLLWDDVAHVVAGKEQKIRFARTLFDWLGTH